MAEMKKPSFETPFPPQVSQRLETLAAASAFKYHAGNRGSTDQKPRDAEQARLLARLIETIKSL